MTSVNFWARCLVPALFSAVAAAHAQSQSAIRLDPTQRQAVGLTLGQVELRPMVKTIRAAVRIDYDERKIGVVTLKVGGWVDELYVDAVGAAVERGAPLLRLYSPDLLTAEREYLLARDTARRLRDSTLPEATASAQAIVDASRERLRRWDVSDADVRDLERRGEGRATHVLVAPQSGVVVEKMVTRGQRVDPGMTLLRIVDLSTVWAHADLFAEEAAAVQLGLEARLHLNGIPDDVPARVTYVAPMLDPTTRTLRVRFELDNSSLHLRPETYGSAELRLELGERLVVPANAAFDAGQRQVVFVDEGDGRLTPRQVRLGAHFDGYREILAGVGAGERVVTSANFLIDSESQLAAAESMLGMMGTLGMGGKTMEGAQMEMSGGGHDEATGGEKQVGDLRVSVLPARGAAVVGRNALHVRVRNADGKPVAGARVHFEYTMDMPGMTIVQTEAKEIEPGLYEGMAQFSMGGPWGVVVVIERASGTPIRERFTVRVTP